ncbi:MAG: AAA family ATPase [Eubacterium sp.]|jgi:predicted ATPase|nr:AAA family ATPase [Eubacterium sp.]
MRDILKGEYRNIEGEERLLVSDSQYVKLNFASSGQQEVVWILNVLFNQIVKNRKTYFIIEEPESHLFPETQKKVMQFIAAVKNSGNEILVTTHSPYILGELNNLLYANNISGKVPKDKLSQIVNEYQWILYSDFMAHFLSRGKVERSKDYCIKGRKGKKRASCHKHTWKI